MSGYAYGGVGVDVIPQPRRKKRRARAYGNAGNSGQCLSKLHITFNRHEAYRHAEARTVGALLFRALCENA